MAIYPEGADLIRPSEYTMSDQEIEDMIMNQFLEEEEDLIAPTPRDPNIDYGKGESGIVEMEGSTINYTLDNPDVLFQEPPAPGYHEIERDGIMYGVEIMEDGSIGSVDTLSDSIVGGDSPIDEQFSPSEGLSIDNYSAYSEKFDEYYNPETGMTWDGAKIDVEISPGGQDLSRMFSAQDLQTGELVGDLLLGTLATPFVGPFPRMKKRTDFLTTKPSWGTYNRMKGTPRTDLNIRPYINQSKGPVMDQVFKGRFSKYDPKLGPWSKAVNAPVNQGGTRIPGPFKSKDLMVRPTINAKRNDPMTSFDKAVDKKTMQQIQKILKKIYGE